jgi:hypothetical protein
MPKTATVRPRKNKMPRSSVSFSPKVKAELRRLAVKKKVSGGWLVRDAVDKYLAAENPLYFEAS